MKIIIKNYVPGIIDTSPEMVRVPRDDEDVKYIVIDAVSKYYMAHHNITDEGLEISLHHVYETLNLSKKEKSKTTQFTFELKPLNDKGRWEVLVDTARYSTIIMCMWINN